MKVKTKKIVCAVLIIGIGTLITFNSYSNASTLKTDVIQVEGGFGYTVSYRGKSLIKQEHIPAIESQMAFFKAADAQKVGNLVAEKIKRKENPKVTLEELKQLKIQLSSDW
ncbi:MAG: DUF4907 domain-containing protein [Flavobacteriaceae bacterium]